ncbi:hypothetical protein Ana3638_07740 [Anaerocolumna sedimenticola]|uniref:Uncharacterized protein n=1 Tax=Anaerocolumna sedimenticola TaxID=2696063 RepID=A0A6P1TL91_9FIRM|nr:hypothetical protein [Anaerocolumna sedimenticola]QHQ60676.1 hypothetical protein Ana3638_07740 [Anaerocolumna sedimenticola]
MNNIKNQINEILKEMNEITELLYQQKSKEGYVLLNGTLGKIMILMDTISKIKTEKEHLFDIERLNNNLKAALDAMEIKDNVMLADILNYEIAEQLKESINL